MTDHCAETTNAEDEAYLEKLLQLVAVQDSLIRAKRAKIERSRAINRGLERAVLLADQRLCIARAVQKLAPAVRQRQFRRADRTVGGHSALSSLAARIMIGWTTQPLVGVVNSASWLGRSPDRRPRHSVVDLLYSCSHCTPCMRYIRYTPH